MRLILKYSYILLFMIMINCNNKKVNFSLEKGESSLNFKTLVQKNVDTNGVLKSQFLIVNSDTTHTILYDDEGKIIYNEGNYACVETTILNSKENQIKITIFSVDIDSLLKAFIISQSYDQYNYTTTIFAEEMDSSYYTAIYSFNDSIVDIIYTIGYLNKEGEAIIKFEFSPLLINFNTKTVDMTPKFKEALKIKEKKISIEDYLNHNY